MAGRSARVAMGREWRGEESEGETATPRAGGREAGKGRGGAKQLPFPGDPLIPRGVLCAIFGRWRGWRVYYATFAASLAALRAARLAAMRARSLACLAAA